MTREVGPIKSDADHEAAMAEIARLWGAPLGARDGDRLDALVTLVDAYENEHHAMDPPAPEAARRFRLKQQGHAPTRG